MREPPQARYREQIAAAKTGVIISIDNCILARIAKLAGAPASAVAGILLHAGSKGEMAYELEYAQKQGDIFQIT